MIDVEARKRSLAWAREILAREDSGRQRRTDSRTIFEAIGAVQATADTQAIGEILVEGFLRESTARCEQYVAPRMRSLEGGRLEMGTPEEKERHFCGEVPRHAVQLSPFSIAEHPVTNRLFGLFDARRLDVPARDRDRPVVEVTWFDAAVFSLWMGCRLPTEAEWEFACAAGSLGEWCCGEESDLPRFAWYSETADGATHPVAALEANSFGLFDLHGNVWEWCEDDYDQDYYARSPLVDPVNRDRLQAAAEASTSDKVCRGGSIHALAEMCRTRYRFHEPADFWAGDLGFRLARSSPRKEECA